MKKVIHKWSIFLFLLGLLLVACDDVLDKSDLSAIEEEDVWNDEKLSEGFLNEIYFDGLDGWPIAASSLSDDAQGSSSTMYGELIPNSHRQYVYIYRNIKDINVLLEKVGTGTLDKDFQSLLKAQALFFRAKHYFSLVSAYGGVPLVLKVLVQGVDVLEVPRNKTSECITQIIADLDSAIKDLPNTYEDEDYGRITKGAAMAFKAKVLLFYASEQFDPTQSASGRWQDAYDAIVAAKANLEANGKGLHPDYAKLWFEESPSNSEIIIVRQFNIDNTHNRDAGCRPFVVGTNGESWDRPTISHANAYPMKDGKSITDATSAYSYDSDVFWVDRDPRFAANIAYNGCIYPLNDPEPQSTSDLLWSFLNSGVERQTRVSASGMYCRKAIDGSIPGGAQTLLSPTDWIDLRFAEVLLFWAEAANEIGNTSEAYSALQDIRQRAGIDAGGDGLYGLQAGMSQDQMRDAILLERRIELAFEGKRSSDLRRRRMYSTINGSIRRGYVIEKTEAYDALDPSSDELLNDRLVLEAGVLDGSIDLNDPATYNTYFTTSISSLERDGNTTDDGVPINFLDIYYFYDLPRTALDKNPSLEQTAGWEGGTFNPLE